MILVDSSVWIDFFRGTPSRQAAVLAQVLTNGQAAICDLALTEVLQGCPTDREFQLLRRMLEAVPVVETGGAAAAVQAAAFYRTLRARGITVRKTIDTLIATRCILDDVPLLYSDRDFEPFVAHLGLRSAVDALSGVN